MTKYADAENVVRLVPEVGKVLAEVVHRWPPPEAKVDAQTMAAAADAHVLLGQAIRRIGRIESDARKGCYPPEFHGNPEQYDVDLSIARLSIMQVDAAVRSLEAQALGGNTTVLDELIRALGSAIGGVGEEWKALVPPAPIRNTPGGTEIVLRARLIALADLVGESRKARQMLYDAAASIGMDRKQARNMVKNFNKGRIGNEPLNRHFLDERERLRPRVAAGEAIAVLFAEDVF